MNERIDIMRQTNHLAGRVMPTRATKSFVREKAIIKIIMIIII